MNDSEGKSNRLALIYRNPLFLLTIITIGITTYLLAKQFAIGVPYYDVFVYLNNALIFAGIPVGNVSVIYLSPLMPFLTSLIFRMGYISANVIFILDAIIYVFGVIGLYLLFRERFNQIQSFTGCLVFLSFPLIFAWATSGGIDIPGVVFSIWTVYALVVGIRKDSKFLYLVFPLLMVAFLARYTSAILIFPMFLYLLMNENFLKNIKKIGIGILAGLALVSPFLIYIYTKLGNLNPFLNIFTSTLLGSGAAANDLGYNPDKLYFLYNILNYIAIGPLQGTYRQIQNPSQGYPSILSYIIVIIVVFGLGIYFYQIIKKKGNDEKNKTSLQLIIMVILLALGGLSFFTAPYLVTEVLFLAAFYAGYRLLKSRGVINLEIDFLFLSWFFAFFIFHSIIPLKVDRYFITMTPALAYFIILGLSTIIEKYKFKIKQEKLKSWGLYLIMGMVLFSCATAVYTGHTPKQGYGVQIQSACDWLVGYDPGYQSKVIYSDYDPAVTWCLKKEVKFAVPRIYVSAESFSRFLIDNKADYYIDALSDQKLDIPGFHVIKKLGSIYIYEADH